MRMLGIVPDCQRPHGHYALVIIGTLRQPAGVGLAVLDVSAPAARGPMIFSRRSWESWGTEVGIRPVPLADNIRAARRSIMSALMTSRNFL